MAFFIFNILHSVKKKIYIYTYRLITLINIYPAASQPLSEPEQWADK